MKITADTNVLIRAVVKDHPAQAEAASDILRRATLIAIPLPCLCEFVWVLRRAYDFNDTDIAAAMRALLATDKVATNRPAAEAGLAHHEAGGDFADGVIAYEGTWLGGETFASFDRKATTLLARQGRKTNLLA